MNAARRSAGAETGRDGGSGPLGLIIEGVDTNGDLIQIDTTGPHKIMSNVLAADIAYGPTGEVLDVVDATGLLIQYDSAGIHPLFSGAQSVAVAVGPRGEVLEVVEGRIPEPSISCAALALLTFFRRRGH